MSEETGGHSRESLGRRVADLRSKLGWTQQEMAERLAISRVAVSHLEAGLTDPSERTVVLLAGLFKVEPRELVAGTSYPMAKAERLPAVAARYTEVELMLELLAADLAWLERTGGDHHRSVLERWEIRLRAMDDRALHPRERQAVLDARRTVRDRRFRSR
jgi:transcriptional regulator with XRE-family HTH domain